MRNWLAVCIVLAVILTITTHAQDETLVITPENIAQLTELEVIGRGVIYNAIYSPDGNLIAVAGSRGIWLYDAHNLDAEPRLFNGHRGPVTTITFSPDGRLLASGSTDQLIIDPDIHLWDVATGEKVATLTGHIDGVGALAFHPSGEWLVSSSWELDETVRVWKMDGNTTEQVAIVPSPGHNHADDNGATDMEFDASGEHLAIAFWDSRKGISDYGSTIEIIAFEDLLAGVANFQLVTNAGLSQLYVSFHPFSPHLAYTIRFNWRIWDFEQQTELFSSFMNPTPSERILVCDVAYDPTGQFLITVELDGWIRFWDVETNTFLFGMRWNDGIGLSKQYLYECRITFSPDGSHLLVNDNNNIRIFDMQTRQKIHTIDFNLPIQQIAFQDSDSLLAIFKKHNRNLDFAQVDLSHPTMIDYPLPYELQNITLSNDGRYFAFLVEEAEETFVYIHDIVEHQTRFFLSKENSMQIRYFDGEKNLLYLSDDVLGENWLYIWDVEAESLLASSTYRDSGWIGAFLPTENPYIIYVSQGFGNDAHWLIKLNLLTGDNEPIGRLWGSGVQFVINEDAGFIIATYEHGFEGMYAMGEKWYGIEVANLYTGDLIRRLTGHILPVTTIALSPDKTLFVSGSLDDTVRIWDIQTGEQVALLDTHTDSITQVLFNHDGTRLATASEDGTIRIWGIAP